MLPLGDVRQILPPPQDLEPVDALPSLARIIIHEADQVVGISGLVGEKAEGQMLARVPRAKDDRARTIGGTPVSG